MKEMNRQQEEMEKAFQKMETLRQDCADVYAMVKPKFYSCDAASNSVTIAFQTEAWERNPLEILHGGITCTFFDCAFGMLTRFLTKAPMVTTVSLSTTFLKPIQIGETALVTAQADSIGSSIVNLTGKIEIKETGLLAATASSTYYLLKKPLKK